MTPLLVPDPHCAVCNGTFVEEVRPFLPLFFTAAHCATHRVRSNRARLTTLGHTILAQQGELSLPSGSTSETVVRYSEFKDRGSIIKSSAEERQGEPKAQCPLWPPGEGQRTSQRIHFRLYYRRSDGLLRRGVGRCRDRASEAISVTPTRWRRTARLRGEARALRHQDRRQGMQG
jgi:hypothetical protein